MTADGAGAATGVLERFSLKDRVVVITGASSGLGAGFSQAMGEAGASLVLGARRVEALEKVAAAARERGFPTLTRATDVTDPEQCDALIAAAMEEFGHVDVLINNAGLGTAVPATRETPAQFRAVVDVNLLGAYWMAQACGRVMLPGSSIVNIASMLGLVKAPLPQAAYASSKAAIIGLTRDLSGQWAGRRGIRVNAVAPGYFATEMTQEMPAALMESWLKEHCPLGRVGEQHELDAAVLFLASPASSYITGATLAVDGGVSGH